MLKNHGHPLYPVLGPDEETVIKWQYDIDKTLVTIVLMQTDLNTCSDDLFRDALHDVTAHGLTIAWRLNHPERTNRIRETLFDNAKNEICIYTQTVDEKLLNYLEKPLQNNMSLHILCDEAPLLETAPVRTVIDHIETTGHGSVTRATANSRKATSDAFGNQHANPHFIMADNKHHIVDRHRNGNDLSIGFNLGQKFMSLRTQAFSHALTVGETVAGYPLQPRKPSVWERLIS